MGISVLASSPAADPTIDEFRAEAHSFLSRHVPPRRHAGGLGVVDPCLFPDLTLAQQREEASRAQAWQRTMFDAGFGWIDGPREFGGRGLTIDHRREFEGLKQLYEVPPPGPLGITIGMVAPTTLAYGSETAKRRWLQAFYRGDAIACQLFSEPGAGSDLASVQTIAHRDGDGWHLEGQKVWSSHARVADVGMVLARTERVSRHGGLTMFLVDMDAQGVEVRPLRQMTGGHSFNEVFLSDVAVADEMRLGDVGAGWLAARTTLMHERAFVGETRRFQLAGALIALARQQDQLDPVTRNLLTELHIAEEVVRLTNLRARARLAAGQPPGPEGSIGKLATTRCLDRASHLASRIAGASLQADGNDDRYSWGGLVLSVPGVHIAGGTDEVQRNIIAERVLGLPREPRQPTE